MPGKSYKAKTLAKERDGCCLKCGRGDKLEGHHVIPSVFGGEDTVTNIITLCKNCHNWVPDMYDPESVDLELLAEIYISTGLQPEFDMMFFGVEFLHNYSEALETDYDTLLEVFEACCNAHYTKLGAHTERKSRWVHAAIQTNYKNIDGVLNRGQIPDWYDGPSWISDNDKYRILEGQPKESPEVRKEKEDAKKLKSIPQIGEKRCELLLDVFGDFESVMSATENELKATQYLWSDDVLFGPKAIGNILDEQANHSYSIDKNDRAPKLYEEFGEYPLLSE